MLRVDVTSFEYSTPVPFFAEILGVRSDTDWKTGLADLLSDWNDLIVKESAFPRNTEAFDVLIEAAGRDCNVRAVRPGRWWAVVRRVDTRYPKLGLKACLDRFFERLEVVPCEPEHRLRQSLSEASGWKREALEFSLSVLDRRQFGKLPKGVNGEHVFRALQEFTSEGFGDALKKPPTRTDYDDDALWRSLTRFLGWAALLDLRQQIHDWWLANQGACGFAQWVCHLNNPEYTKHLTRIFPSIVLHDYEGAAKHEGLPGVRKARWRRRKKWQATIGEVLRERRQAEVRIYEI